MKRTTCSVRQCDRPSHCRGLCQGHYTRLLRHGDVRPAIPLRRSDRTVAERFWERVRKTDTCWLWTGFINDDGYGQFKPETQVPTGAHRFAYELLVGPIPDGYQIDHVRARGCVNRNCVNPAHLEAVTPIENTRRSTRDGGPGWLGRRTTCTNGHPLSGANLGIRSDGHRKCLACHRDWQKDYLARKRAGSCVA